LADWASGVLEVSEDRVYMATALRNAGSGLAVLHGWRAAMHDAGAANERPALDEFHRQQLDLYIASAGSG
jgi:hypothetical protein